MVICPACTEEIFNRSKRRYRYPFAHCSYGGPKFSIIKRSPVIRANTAFAALEPCAACLAEAADPTSRHYRAETIVCPQCGPQIRLIRFDDLSVLSEQHSLLDDVDAACSLIQKGELLAIKTPSGYQLVCDATNVAAVVRLRQAKLNGNKPLPLMARDLHVIARYCAISVEEEFQLTSAQGPLVVLRAAGEARLPEEVGPGLTTLAFMLPTTALHFLLLHRMNRPVVMTSANLSGEPQIIDDDELREKLGNGRSAVRHALVYDQRIINRCEDSVVRIIGGRARLMRRSRGYTPVAIELPEGFEPASDLVAIGGDHKAAFCLVKDGEAIPSQHYGEISSEQECAAYEETICRHGRLLCHELAAVVVDAHQGYHSSRGARMFAAHAKLGVIEAQHHHAHIAACLAENDYALDAPPVLGIVLDGPGPGDDGTVWGGEFLLADYRGTRRLASLKPIAWPGGREAEREPWRALHAHLAAAFGWPAFVSRFSTLELCHYLESKLPQLPNMAGPSSDTPKSTACAHLFDAVAAALGLCRDEQTYDGEAAMRFEAIVDESVLQDLAQDALYPVALHIPDGSGLPTIDLEGMWCALFGDLLRQTPTGVVAARFHCWLAASVSAMATALTRKHNEQEVCLTTVALSGGCFQNRILLEETERLLRKSNFTVLSHERVPTNAGGLCLGQAAIGAAHTPEPGRRVYSP